VQKNNYQASALSKVLSMQQTIGMSWFTQFTAVWTASGFNILTKLFFWLDLFRITFSPASTTI